MRWFLLGVMVSSSSLGRMQWAAVSLSCRGHGAELAALEALAFLADAFLAVEHRHSAIELDAKSDQRLE